jgi:hypothetical protein
MQLRAGAGALGAFVLHRKSADSRDNGTAFAAA